MGAGTCAGDGEACVVRVPEEQLTSSAIDESAMSEFRMRRSLSAWFERGSSAEGNYGRRGDPLVRVLVVATNVGKTRTSSPHNPSTPSAISLVAAVGEFTVQAITRPPA